MEQLWHKWLLLSLIVGQYKTKLLFIVHVV